MDAAREKGVSERRACTLVGISRLTYRYRGRDKGDGPIRERMRALAHRWLRFGYRRLGVMLEREKMAANHKRIYRLYTEEGLKVRRKRKKLRSQVRTAPMWFRPGERAVVHGLHERLPGYRDGGSVR